MRFEDAFMSFTFAGDVRDGGFDEVLDILEFGDAYACSGRDQVVRCAG